MSELVEEQPAPVPNDSEGIWSKVIADMRDRDDGGKRKYGTRLQAFNGRDPLVDLYQEGLDLVVYARQAIEEAAVIKAEAAKLRQRIEYGIRGNIEGFVEDVSDFLKLVGV